MRTSRPLQGGVCRQIFRHKNTNPKNVVGTVEKLAGSCHDLRGTYIKARTVITPGGPPGGPPHLVGAAAPESRGGRGGGTGADPNRGGVWEAGAPQD